MSETTVVDNREDGGRLVRQIWIEVAATHIHPKPSHLVPWEELDEWNREVDRIIWERITAPYRQSIQDLGEVIGQLQEARDFWFGEAQ